MRISDWSSDVCSSDLLVKAFPGKVVAFSGISEDGNRVLMHVYSDRDPGQVYLFDRKAGQARFLLSSRQWIKPDEMSPMKPVKVKTRDGLVIHGYLNVPAGSDGKKLPLLVHPHGGTHGTRDEWGFNPEVQDRKRKRRDSRDDGGRRLAADSVKKK